MVPNPWARRAGTIHVSYRRRSAESVGSDPARRAAPVTGRAGPGGRPTGRSGVLHPVRAVLRLADRSAVDADGDLPAADVSQVPLPEFRYQLGFESLCREVSDSFTWRQFCRIGIDQPVPHPTTLMKLTTRCGSAAVEGLNEALLAKAVEAKLLRCTRVRVDTTVVPANVAYPNDSGLLAKAVRRIAVTGRRVQAAGGATRTRVRDRSRAAGRRAHDLNA